jgi:hypothetical protein
VIDDRHRPLTEEVPDAEIHHETIPALASRISTAPDQSLRATIRPGGRVTPTRARSAHISHAQSKQQIKLGAKEWKLSTTHTHKLIRTPWSFCASSVFITFVP